MNLQNKKFQFSDGTEYVIVETVEYDGKSYVYMVNTSNAIDSMYGEVKQEDNLVVESIEPTLFREKILPLFLEKYKNY